MSMSNGRFIGLGLVVAAMLVAACGGDADDDVARTPVVAVTPASTVLAPSASGTPVPITEFKVAFINLHSPLTVDGSPIAGDTFEARLGILIEEMRRFKPDLIAFNEASVTTYGNTIERLVSELKMEFYYARANPWPAGKSREQSDEIAKQFGHEEGELIFSRYPILVSDPPIALSPLSSESGERRVLLHAVVKAPAPLNELDVYVTHLTGGGERIRESQAADVVQHIKKTQKDRPAILIGDMGDPVGSPTYKVFSDAGFSDPGWQDDLPTCCRTTVVGEQKALTTRPDSIMAQSFSSGSMQVFGQHPITRSDGTKLYASDHNGLFAVFSLDGG